MREPATNIWLLIQLKTAVSEVRMRDLMTRRSFARFCKAAAGTAVARSHDKRHRGQRRYRERHQREDARDASTSARGGGRQSAIRVPVRPGVRKGLGK